MSDELVNGSVPTPAEAIRAISRSMSAGEVLFKNRVLWKLEDCLASGKSLAEAIQSVREMEIL